MKTSFIILIHLLFGIFVFAQAPKIPRKLEIKQNFEKVKFDFQGKWKVVKVDMPIELKPGMKPKPFPIVTSDLIDRDFNFKDKTVCYEYRGKALMCAWLEKRPNPNKLIMRQISGGWEADIVSNSNGDAVLSLNNPGFLLFITHIVKGVYTQQNVNELDAFYHNLLDTYQVGGSEKVNLYLKKL